MYSLSPVLKADLFNNAAHYSKVVSLFFRFITDPWRFSRILLARTGFLTEGNRKIFGQRFHTSLTAGNAAAVYYSGILSRGEDNPKSYLLKILNSKSVFYYVGANIGFYSALAISHGAIVHAFEPSERNFRYLSMNAQEATLNHAAVEEKSEIKDFYDSSSAESSFVLENSPKGSPRKVQIVSLDEYVKSNPYPEVVKIDVEGWEYEVLLGMIDLLKGGLTIAMECTGSEKSRKALEFLRKESYIAHKILSNGELVVALEPKGGNFVFMRN